MISVSINPDYYITQSNTTRGLLVNSIVNVHINFCYFTLLLCIIVASSVILVCSLRHFSFQFFLFNVCIFISSSYVVIKLKINQQKRNQPLLNENKVPMSSKNACKLLALLAGFMLLLGLSWIILSLELILLGTKGAYASVECYAYMPV